MIRVAGDIQSSSRRNSSGRQLVLKPLGQRWVDFVVDSLLCSKRFFSGYSGFPSSQNQHFQIKIQFWNAWTFLNESLWTPRCFVGKQITYMWYYIHEINISLSLKWNQHLWAYMFLWNLHFTGFDVKSMSLWTQVHMKTTFQHSSRKQCLCGKTPLKAPPGEIELFCIDQQQKIQDHVFLLHWRPHAKIHALLRKKIFHPNRHFHMVLHLPL